jgi:hypothetical protein
VDLSHFEEEVSLSIEEIVVNVIKFKPLTRSVRNTAPEMGIRI